MASTDGRRVEERDGARPPLSGPVAASLAARLDHLSRTVHPPDREEYTYREAAAAIEAASVATITAAYINYLRLGRRDNPTLRQLKALADFFDVPVSYFTDADELHAGPSRSGDRELVALAVRMLGEEGLDEGTLQAIRMLRDHLAADRLSAAPSHAANPPPTVW